MTTTYHSSDIKVINIPDHVWNQLVQSGKERKNNFKIAFTFCIMLLIGGIESYMKFT